MNSIMTLKPYCKDGVWQFDDESKGLKGEAFIAGIDTIIEMMTADIPNAEDGFTLVFSPGEFPDHQARLDWIEADMGGNWYALKSEKEDFAMKGWLCPALYKYFDVAPKQLYFSAQPLKN